MPNLARSCRGPPVIISSIARSRARPNVAGQTERARAHHGYFLHRGQQDAARQLFFDAHR